MEIKPNEIDSIKVVGTLNGSDVKLIKTTGGFYCAVGMKSKSKKTVEPISAGSHQALVLHQIEKEFKSDFKPALMKSESEILPIVKEFTEKLPHELVMSGYSVYSLTKNSEVNFIATKIGAEVLNIKGIVTEDGIRDVKKVSQKEISENIGKIAKVIADEINEQY